MNDLEKKMKRKDSCNAAIVHSYATVFIPCYCPALLNDDPPSLCYYAFDLLTTVVAMLGMSIILDFHE